MTEANETPKLMERVVVGKPFSVVDPKSGKRYSAQPGQTVYVRPLTASKHPKQLVDPRVAAAQKLAADAEAEAVADAAKLQAAAVPAAPVQQAPAVAESAPTTDAVNEGEGDSGGDQ